MGKIQILVYTNVYNKTSAGRPGDFGRMLIKWGDRSNNQLSILIRVSIEIIPACL